MEPAQLVAALEALAARLGIPVRYDALARAVPQGRNSGGLCRLRGQPLILVDERLGLHDRAAILAQALAACDLGGIYVPPLVRAAIRAQGPTDVLTPRPLARGRPDRKKPKP